MTQCTTPSSDLKPPQTTVLPHGNHPCHPKCQPASCRQQGDGHGFLPSERQGTNLLLSLSGITAPTPKSTPSKESGWYASADEGFPFIWPGSTDPGNNDRSAASWPAHRLCLPAAASISPTTAGTVPGWELAFLQSCQNPARGSFVSAWKEI